MFGLHSSMEAGQVHTSKGDHLCRFMQIALPCKYGCPEASGVWHSKGQCGQVGSSLVRHMQAGAGTVGHSQGRAGQVGSGACVQSWRSGGSLGVLIM